MPYWVVVDIGCIECGAKTTVIGVFTKSIHAEEAAGPEDGRDYYPGEQHSIQVFEVAELDTGERTDIVARLRRFIDKSDAHTFSDF